jgi:hypothetical protein
MLKLTAEILQTVVVATRPNAAPPCSQFLHFLVVERLVIMYSVASAATVRALDFI